MQPDSGLHLWDATVAARLVRDFTSGRTATEFTQDLIIRSAVERQLEILGEALNRLRREDMAAAARVPSLDEIVGMRNIIAHEYGSIDYEIVWIAATIEVPALIPVLEELVQEAKGMVGQ